MPQMIRSAAQEAVLADEAHMRLCVNLMRCAMRDLPEPTPSFSPGKVSYSVTETMQGRLEQAAKAIVQETLDKYAVQIRERVKREELTKIIEKMQGY